MHVSIVTITYNDADTVQETIDCVRQQSHESIEYVVKDGGSDDGTIDIIEDNLDIIDRWVSMPDDGLFDALNEGIRMASGDVVGILHADDLFAADDVVEEVSRRMSEEDADVCWGDLVYVERDSPDAVVRYWESSEYKPGRFARGWMPPHVTFFARRELFEECGDYDLDFNYAADYELMLRFLRVCNADSTYIPSVLTKMRVGGVSDRSITNIGFLARNQWDCYRAYRANGLPGGYLIPILKPLTKLPQSFRTPPVWG